MKLTAETALEAVVHFLTRYGCPPRMTFDRDTRLRSAVTACAISPQHSVASCCAWAFSPTSARRADPTKIPMWSGCTARSTRNGGLVRLPTTLGEVREATKGFLWHYNQERPHQGTACGNRPPQVAFPSLPALPPLPERVDPDRWLDAIHGRGFSRKIGTDGVVDVDDEHYYIQQALAGQRVVLLVSAPDRTFEVWLEGRLIKSLPIKGLVVIALNDRTKMLG